jgi:membrane protein YqaA with SNARE-associated domain
VSAGLKPGHYKPQCVVELRRSIPSHRLGIKLRPYKRSCKVYGTEESGLLSGLSGWKQKVVAFAGGLGAPGLFLVSFLDSSVLTFPVINDLLLIELSIQHPARMPLYAFLAMLGSILGCVLLFYLAEKGGEALFHKHAGDRAQAIHNWVVKNGFSGMLVAALLPPPTPFKVFVVAAGVFEVPLTSFASAITVARAVRYFGIGYLAIRYGREAMPYLMHHKLTVTGLLIILALVSYLLSRVILRHKPPASGAN